MLRCYRVIFEPASEIGITTGKTKSCLCCGEIISTIGGGGEFICDNCHELMYHRKFWDFARNMKFIGDNNVFL